MVSALLVGRVNVCSLLLFMAAFFSLSVSSAQANPSSADSFAENLHALQANRQYEPSVIDIVEKLQSGQLEQALKAANLHLSIFPKSRIGHLLKADILNSMAGPLANIGAESALPQNELQGLLKQIRSRWQHHQYSDSKAHQLLPASLLHIGDHPYVLVADMKLGRLYVYENNEGQPELVRDYYMSVGSQGYGKQVEGDNKTPIGVYHVNRYIEGKRLPDLYGKGAFPVNYPNRFDRYLKRTGYGIWLHGTPSTTYARAPWTSEGCFVLSNDDLIDISQFVSADAKTPVILSDDIQWVERNELNAMRNQYLQVVNQWKSDWESLDTQAYLSHYAQRDLNFGATDFRSWAARKHMVNQNKTFIQVDIDIQEMFVYPGEKDMFVVKYTQHYLSNNYEGSVLKQQYWKRSESGDWKIIYEG